jgi:hypothetical protein
MLVDGRKQSSSGTGMVFNDPTTLTMNGRPEIISHEEAAVDGDKSLKIRR